MRIIPFVSHYLMLRFPQRMTNLTSTPACTFLSLLLQLCSVAVLAPDHKKGKKLEDHCCKITFPTSYISANIGTLSIGKLLNLLIPIYVFPYSADTVRAEHP